MGWFLCHFPLKKNLLPWSLASLNEPLSRWNNISALPDLQSSKKVLIFLLTAQGPPSSPYDSLHQLLTLLYHKKFVGTNLFILLSSSAQELCSAKAARVLQQHSSLLLSYSVHIGHLRQMWTSPYFYPQEMAWIHKLKATDELVETAASKVGNLKCFKTM